MNNRQRTLLSLSLFVVCLVQANGKPQVNTITQKLDSIIIPKVSFQKAEVGQVVEFLQQISKKYDPAKKGVNIDLIDVNNQSKITLDMRKASLHKILKHVGEMANLSVDVEADGVALRK